MLFCSSVLPLGGSFTSTCTPVSFSYLATPAAAIFQNSLALFVTNASFRELGSEAFTICGLLSAANEVSELKRATPRKQTPHR